VLEGERLQAEADRLHRVLFGRSAPDSVRRQYARVIGRSPLADVPRCDVAKLIERGVDLEAVEAALRRRSPLNSLTQRFHVLCYLVEVRPEYFTWFVSERSSFGRGVLALGVETLRSLYKTAKGRVLLWVYDVV
jgi:hypothetical protein